jgi:hypothetical protein
MVAWLLLVIVLVMLIYGLERNHRRQRRDRVGGGSELIGRLVGSTDVVDRDVQRLAADLRALDPASRRSGRWAGSGKLGDR